MREIKFRAWDKKECKMYNITHLSFMKNSDGTAENRGCEGYYGDNHRSKFSLDEIELMQHTGLKDKNGKEIYEGDIGTHHYWKYNGTVEWIDGALKFVYTDGVKETLRNIDMQHYEIIGNIYENKELLSSN